MGNNLEISVELARQVLPCLEGRLKYCEDSKKEFDAEIAQIKTSIAELKAKLADAEKPPVVDGIIRKRQLKGHVAKVIADLLAPLQDEKGLTISEIRNRTGFNRSVIYKTLHRETGKFESDRKGKLWKLKKQM
ncbi:MAG: hypothetical protein ABSD57_09115 [Verrucomicrobiota bacterium]|jgi:hypothetical protein